MREFGDRLKRIIPHFNRESRQVDDFLQGKTGQLTPEMRTQLNNFSAHELVDHIVNTQRLMQFNFEQKVIDAAAKKWIGQDGRKITDLVDAIISHETTDHSHIALNEEGTTELDSDNIYLCKLLIGWFTESELVDGIDRLGKIMEEAYIDEPSHIEKNRFIHGSRRIIDALWVKTFIRSLGSENQNNQDHTHIRQVLLPFIRYDETDEVTKERISDVVFRITPDDNSGDIETEFLYKALHFEHWYDRALSEILKRKEFPDINEILDQGLYTDTNTSNMLFELDSVLIGYAETKSPDDKMISKEQAISLLQSVLKLGISYYQWHPKFDIAVVDVNIQALQEIYPDIIGDEVVHRLLHQYGHLKSLAVKN